ncbi:MAG TPA: peptide-methionine (S)-S-oxide reductase MsrA [Candidatus Methylomirabilis sp.]|nr:peptide-methionine (S)-S-oxide reductase MsrA [Candidatus Methylomirabilis sp.]
MVQGRMTWVRSLLRVLVLLPVVGAVACNPAHGQVPEFAEKSESPTIMGEQTAVLAGGCFWGVDAVFKHVRGVSNVVSGYAGGSAETAQYELVSTGTTGHAEAVQIAYDPAQISYSQLLRVFFSVAHDPTELNRQGPDTGTQYRSAIFYATPEQRRTALAYIEQLDTAKVFPATIVTQVAPLQGFYPAEEYHQNFLARHPNYPYIVFNDLPKLRALQKQFPALYKP